MHLGITIFLEVNQELFFFSGKKIKWECWYFLCFIYFIEILAIFPKTDLLKESTLQFGTLAENLYAHYYMLN